MKIYIFLVLLLAIQVTVSSQTIEEMEYDLSWRHSSEEEGGKIDRAWKLHKRDPFNHKAAEYICRYYNDRNIDSVSVFFERLIANHPHRPETFVLIAEFLGRDETIIPGTYKIKRIKYLNQALNLDNTNREALFKLAEIYYTDFIFPLQKERDEAYKIIFESQETDSTAIEVEKTVEIKKSTFDYAADSALVCFYKLWLVDETIRDVIYFPIRQLECYLSKEENSPISIGTQEGFEKCYFPSWYFANLGEHWQCDSTINYLYEIQSSKKDGERLKLQLTDLKESCLYDAKVAENSIVYRFTWLRSFDHPISIRIEKTGKKVILTWKIGKGEGGYAPKGLKKAGKKRIGKNKWDAFMKHMHIMQLDSLPNEMSILTLDGASWTFERKTANGYKAHRTNWPRKTFQEACLFLLKLSNIRIKDRKIY